MHIIEWFRKQLLQRKPSLFSENATSVIGDTVEHTLSVAQMSLKYPLSRINADCPLASLGLSAGIAAKKLQTHGKNMLTTQREASMRLLFFSQLKNPFWILLFAAGVLSLLTYFADRTVSSNLFVSLALFVIVFLMVSIAFYEERKSRNPLHGFSRLLPERCIVVREGEQREIPSEHLVVGDLVWIRENDRVPADIRLLHVNELKLEASSITGESRSVEYTSEVPAGDADSLFVAHNVALHASMCTSGEGLGVAIRTGDDTILGQIASLATQQAHDQSRVQGELTKFVRIVAVSALFMATVVFAIAVGNSRGYNALQLFVAGFLVTIVANVPQGLPLIVTCQLAIVARRLAKAKLFVKQLPAMHALGATTIILCDKTGTWTKNEMVVSDLWYNSSCTTSVPASKRKCQTWAPKQDISSMLDAYEQPFPQLLTAMTLCNKATQQKSKRSITVCADDQALTNYVTEMIAPDMIRQQYKVVFEILFSSARKYHLVITTPKESGCETSVTCPYMVTVKGAPEVLIQMCNRWKRYSAERAVDLDFLRDLQDACYNFACEGKRLLAFCSTVFDAPRDVRFSEDEGNFPLSGLCFLGLVVTTDAPRSDASSLVRLCVQAGIKLFLVSGDHQATVTAIARQTGVLETNAYDSRAVTGPNIASTSADLPYAVIHGDQVFTMTTEDWNTLVRKRSVVFVRTTTEQKLHIVKQCRYQGEVVCAMGDGVSDALALKKADIGVAVAGPHSSAIAKQAASVVMTSDNLVSLLQGIREGRILFENLKKAFAYTLTHLAPELFAVLMNFVLGFPTLLTSLQILSIDCGTELAPAIALVYEPAEGEVMQPSQYRHQNRLITKSLLFYSYCFTGSIISVACFLAYCWAFWSYGIATSDLLFSNNNYWKASAEPFYSNGLCFNATDQVRINGEATGSYYITLVISQLFHCWICKERYHTLFRFDAASISVVGIFAMIIQFTLVIVFVYIPGLQSIMGVATPPATAWIPCFCCGATLLVFSECRKLAIKKWPTSTIVQMIRW